MRDEEESLYRIKSFRVNKGFFILKLERIDSIDQAERLVGKEIYVPEKELQILDEGYYYNFQLLGCSVFTRDGRIIGTVRDIINIKENELLEIEKEGRIILIPFSQSICLEVDPGKKTIVIDPPDGLLELNEI